MGNSEKRKKRPFEKGIMLAGALEAVFAVITSFQKIKLPWIVYVILCFFSLVLLTSIIAVFIWEDRKIKKKLEKKENRYDKKIVKSRKKRKMHFIVKKDKANMNYKKHRKANRSKLFSATLLLVAFVILCFGQPENTKAAIQWVKQFINNDKTDNLETKDTEVTNQDKDKRNDFNFDNNIEDDENPDNSKAKKQEENNFVLKEANRKLELEKEIENQIYFWSAGDGSQELEETCRKRIEELRHARKRNADIYKISSKYGLDFDSLEEEEAEFKRKVEACRNLEYEADWIAVAPDSDELDDYIGGRKQLNSMKIDDIQGCYILCWRLANDYQYYALEYEAQTENAQAIYYYYSMSIYYCMEAMKYDITDSERAEAENYLLSRYEDLARGDCIVDKEYKERAGEIAEILKDIL